MKTAEEVQVGTAGLGPVDEGVDFLLTLLPQRNPQLDKHLQWLRQVGPAVWSGGRGVPNYQRFRDTGSSRVRQKIWIGWSRLLTTALQLGLKAGPGY